MDAPRSDAGADTAPQDLAGEETPADVNPGPEPDADPEPDLARARARARARASCRRRCGTRPVRRSARRGRGRGAPTIHRRGAPTVLPGLDPDIGAGGPLSPGPQQRERGARRQRQPQRHQVRGRQLDDPGFLATSSQPRRAGTGWQRHRPRDSTGGRHTRCRRREVAVALVLAAVRHECLSPNHPDAANPDASLGIHVGLQRGIASVWSWSQSPDESLVAHSVASPGGWTHLAYTYKAGSHVLYVGGAQVGTSRSTTAAAPPPPSSCWAPGRPPTPASAGTASSTTSASTPGTHRHRGQRAGRGRALTPPVRSARPRSAGPAISRN